MIKLERAQCLLQLFRGLLGLRTSFLVLGCLAFHASKVSGQSTVCRITLCEDGVQLLLEGRDLLPEFSFQSSLKIGRLMAEFILQAMFLCIGSKQGIL